MKERNLIILIVGIILLALLLFSNMNQINLNIPDNQVNDSNSNQEVHQESNTQYTPNNNNHVEEVSEDTKNIKPTDSSSNGNNT